MKRPLVVIGLLLAGSGILGSSQEGVNEESCRANARAWTSAPNQTGADTWRYTPAGELRRRRDTLFQCVNQSHGGKPAVEVWTNYNDALAARESAYVELDDARWKEFLDWDAKRRGSQK